MFGKNSRRKGSEIENVQEKYTKRQMNKTKIKYRLQQITERDEVKGARQDRK